jgi:hypothetical protein
MVNETNSNLTPEQMAARIAELEGRLAKGSSLSFKVSEKGAVSVYGLGRFPVTLYLEQWVHCRKHLLVQKFTLEKPDLELHRRRTIRGLMAGFSVILIWCTAFHLLMQDRSIHNPHNVLG